MRAGPFVCPVPRETPAGGGLPAPGQKEARKSIPHLPNREK